MTDTQRAAELQVLLEGIPLPAGKQELIDYASRQNGGGGFVSELRSLPDEEYESLDDVGEALVPVQPQRGDERLAVPHEESGQPPGGSDYTTSHPVPGGIRPDWPEDNPPQQVVQHQSEQQKTQKQRQESGG